MLKPCNMSKLQITGPKNYMEQVIGELHKLKVYHIVEHTENEDIDIGEPLEKADLLSEIIVRIRSLSSHLNIEKKEIKKEFKLKNGYKSLDVVSKNLLLKVNENLDKLKTIQSDIEKNNVIISQLDELKALKINLEAFSSFNSISSFIGYVKNTENLDESIQKVTPSFELFKTDTKSKLIALFVEKSKEQKISDMLKDMDFTEFDSSALSNMEGDININIMNLNKENSGLYLKEQMVVTALEKIKKEWSEFLRFSEEYVARELEKLEAPLKFAATKNVFLINGWVPTKQLEKVKNNLNNVSNNKLFFDSQKVDKNDKVPIKLDNPKAAQPFEFFLNMYSLPKYTELDPTFFIFLIFPLMFGFMLGDMGYGLVTVLLMLLLMKKMPKFKGFFTIFLYSGLATIFFGALFGEVFGAEVIFGVALPHIFSRAHSGSILLGLSVLIGVGHLFMGLIIGFINIYKQHGLMHAIYEKVGWMLLLPFIMKLLLMFQLIKDGLGDAVSSILPNDYITYGLLILGVILIIKGEGAMGLVELPGIFGNILSYARIMAISLASVMLAVVINQEAGKLFAAGGFMVVLGILIVIIGHIINIALGWLGCFLHPLRLHYVEFFTKFFKGGAQPFKPFGVR